MCLQLDTKTNIKTLMTSNQFKEQRKEAPFWDGSKKLQTLHMKFLFLKYLMILLTFHHNRLPEPREPVLCFSSASIVFTCIVIRLHQTERTGRWMLRFGWPGCLRTFCSRLQCFSQINSEQQPFATKLDPLTADQTTHVLRSMLLGREKINSEHSLFFFESRLLDIRAHRCKVYLAFGI